MSNIDKEKYFESIKLFVLDMDGTIYLGDKLLRGSLEFIERIKSSSKDFLFFTNNSSKTSIFYKEKLNKMGFDVERTDILTSGDITIDYLNEHHLGKSIYLLGTPLLTESFLENNINLVEDNPDIVVVAFDTTLTYEKLDKACRYIRNGAIFIATHLDVNCPTEDGFMPDCGAMCELISMSTGVKPKYLGKPFLETLQGIMRVKDVKKEEILFIGDRIYTDVAMGINNGARGVLVLSGESDMETVKNSDIKPDFIFEGIYEILDFI